MNKKKTGIFLILGILLAVVVFVALGSMQEKEPEEVSTVEPADEEDADVITYNGKKYERNTDIRTILFLGVDRRQETEINDTPGYNGQADTILLYVLNKEKKTASRLEISRDTMTDIALYDMAGEYLASERAQIAMQYAYGDSPKKSCLLMEEAVSNLLYGIPVRGYFSMTLDGIGPVVDALGGVTITVPEDYTYIEPEFQQGQEVTLDGRLAERYVRYRDTEVTGSNVPRMERQRQFMDAFMAQASEKMKVAGVGVLDSILDANSEYFATDLTADEMKEMTEYQMDPEVIKVPGTVVAGEEHDEYVVDDEKLMEICINLFYKPVN